MAETAPEKSPIPGKLLVVPQSRKEYVATIGIPASHAPRSKVLGSELITWLDRERRFLHSLGDAPSRLLKAELQKLDQEKHTRLEEIRSAMTIAGQQDDVYHQGSFESSIGTYLTFSELAALSDDDLELALRRHNETLSTREEKLKEKVAVWKPLLMRILEERNLPGLDPEAMRQKIAETPVRLFDSAASLGTDSHSYANADLLRSQIEFPSDARPDLEFSHFTHEMLHILAGKGLRDYTSASGDDGMNFTFVEPVKSGLHMQYKFDWLDEAFTELLTQSLTNTASQGYIGEVELLRLLLSKGKSRIALEQITPAYFENIDPTLPPGERVPEWKKFMKLINDTYAPGFLMHLQRFLDLQDPKTAIADATKVMATDWRKFMENTSKPSNSTS